MPEKDPWEAYGFTAGDEDGAWIVPGAEIIPLPDSKCPDHVADWTIPRQKDPTPYDMPVFVIDRIITFKNGRRRVFIYMSGAPSIRADRDLEDIKDKWRLSPGPEPEPEIQEPVILSRYERKFVI